MDPRRRRRRRDVPWLCLSSTQPLPGAVAAAAAAEVELYMLIHLIAGVQRSKLGPLDSPLSDARRVHPLSLAACRPVLKCRPHVFYSRFAFLSSSMLAILSLMEV